MVVVIVLGTVEMTGVLLDVIVDEDDDDDEDGASSVLPPAGCSCEEEVLVTEVAGTVVAGTVVVVMVGVVGVEMSSCTVGRIETVEERTSTAPPLSRPSISVSSAVASCSVCCETGNKWRVTSQGNDKKNDPSSQQLNTPSL